MSVCLYRDEETEDQYTQVLGQTVFVRATLWNQLRCLEWLNGQGKCGTHIQWSTIQPQRRNGVMSFVRKSVELESTTLSKNVSCALCVCVNVCVHVMVYV